MSYSTVQEKFVYLAIKCPFKVAWRFFFQVAFVNGVLFVTSIGIFFWIMIKNTLHRSPIKPDPQQVLKNTCPPLPEGSRWALWAPGASLQPVILQFYLTHKLRIFRSDALRVCPIRDGGAQNHILLFGKNQAKRAAVTHRHFVAWKYHIFLRVSSLYDADHAYGKLKIRFISRVACVLVLNNLMVAVRSPWLLNMVFIIKNYLSQVRDSCPMVWLWVSLLSFKFLLFVSHCSRSPFHASLGIATCRMLIHLRKFAEEVLEVKTGTHFLPDFEVDSSAIVPWRLSPAKSTQFALDICDSSRSKAVEVDWKLSHPPTRT